MPGNPVRWDPLEDQSTRSQESHFSHVSCFSENLQKKKVKQPRFPGQQVHRGQAGLSIAFCQRFCPRLTYFIALCISGAQQGRDSGERAMRMGPDLAEDPQGHNNSLIQHQTMRTEHT